MGNAAEASSAMLEAEVDERTDSDSGRVHGSTCSPFAQCERRMLGG